MSKEKKFLRQCISCRELKSKQELIRITKDYKTSEIHINNDSSYAGRSVYVCKNEHCIEKLIKNKKIINSLKADLPENIKVKLATVLTN